MLAWREGGNALSVPVTQELCLLPLPTGLAQAGTAQGWHSTGLVAHGSLQNTSVSLKGSKFPLLMLEQRKAPLAQPPDPACLCCSNMCRWQLLQVLIQPKRGMLKGCVRSVPRNDRRQALTEGGECPLTALPRPPRPLGTDLSVQH